MPFCYSPWTNVDISPQGDITPCCKFQRVKYDQRFNILSSTVAEYQKSDLLNNVQQDFKNNKWPAGCERCQIEEEKGIKSKRLLDYERWQTHYDQYKLDCGQFITASIAFGNTCNLTCITCNSGSSSKWQKEYKDVYGMDIKPLHFYKEGFVSDFLTQSPNIIHIDIPGGEPFLSGVTEQRELLEHYVRTGRAQSITLHYTTNATIFPDQTWWDLWPHFKEIDMQLSIDDVQHRYEYIRYPASWSTLETNLDHYLLKQQELNNFRLSISQTVSVFNIFYLGEFFNWINFKQLPTPWLGRVHYPAHMRPTVWPQDTRQHIQNHLRSYNNVELVPWIQLLDLDDSEHFKRFQETTNLHDSNRLTNFKTTFPEMAEYFDQK